MTKLFLSVAAAGLLAAPAAHAAAYSFSRLSVSNVSVAFSPSPTNIGTTLITSANSATYLGTGISSGDSTTIPGTADAPGVTDPGFVVAENELNPVLGSATATRADSSITALSISNITADAVAEGRVIEPDFAVANGETSSSFAFRAAAGTIISITLDALQQIMLETDFEGETAIAATSLDWSITDGIQVNPTVSGPFDLNTSISRSDGDDFMIDRSGTFTFSFLALAGGRYTLSFTHGAGIDVNAEDVVDIVPAPAALGVFGLGLAGIGLARRRRA